MGATGISTASRKSSVVFRVLCGGGEWVRGSPFSNNGVVSEGNMVLCEGFGWGAVVDSWRSSVRVGLFPGDVVVSGVFWGDSRGVWG